MAGWIFGTVSHSVAQAVLKFIAIQLLPSRDRDYRYELPFLDSYFNYLISDLCLQSLTFVLLFETRCHNVALVALEFTM